MDIVIIVLGAVLGILSGWVLFRIAPRLDYSYRLKYMPAVAFSLHGLYGMALGYLYSLQYSSAFSPAQSILFLAFFLTGNLAISGAVIDLQYQEIPDSYNLIMAVIGILIFVFPYYRVEGSLIVAGVSFAFYFLLAVVTGGMGGGDIKMVGALGLLVPLTHMYVFLMGPFIVGSVVAIPLLILRKKKMKSEIPFGPFIVICFLYVSISVLSSGL